MKNLRRVSILSVGLGFLAALGCSDAISSKGGGASPPETSLPTMASGSPTGSATGSGTTTGTANPAIGLDPAPSAGTGSGTGTATGSGVPKLDGTTDTGGPGSTTSTGAAGAAGTVITPPPNNNGNAGLLTAGSWDDNLNFDFYTKYLATMNASQLAGLPLIDRTNRLEITAVDGAGAPLAGANISVSDGTGKLFEATTRGDGKLFVFPVVVGAHQGEPLTIGASFGQATGTAAAQVGDATVKVTVTGATAAPVAALDLALVVDTTGSMGDELSYLKNEIGDIIARVKADYPGVSQRWAAIFYRDTVDEYVVRAFDFTTDLATLESELSAQSAAGGGDIPEAPDQALAKLPTLSWRPDAVARMAFWVADAPHHAKDAAVMVQDIVAAHAKGIRFYPIAASGTDDLLEYTMREAAEVTGGRYLFLTNDSGIGGSHKEPTVPCYVVTTLDNAMKRMIDMELTGTDAPPKPADIIRTSGNPTGNTCTLSGGDIVTIL